MTLDRRIYNFLKEVGVPCSVRGFDAIKIGVRYLVENNCRHLKMVDDVYPYIAKQLDDNSTVSQVERRIRHAVQNTLVLNNPDALEKYFGATVRMSTGIPTNSEFLYRLANEVIWRMEEEKNV